MEELNSFQILASRILYLIGWLIQWINRIINGSNSQIGFRGALVYLVFGISLAFASLHIFKRFLRKG